jgi:hypothetical protein
MAINHAHSFLKGLPLKGVDITFDSAGSVIGATYRILDVSGYKPVNRVKMEDINESGQLVGEYQDDLQETINVKIAVPTGFDPTDIKPGFEVTISLAASHTYKALLDGQWQIDDPTHDFKADNRAEISLTLRRNANLSTAAQNP